MSKNTKQSLLVGGLISSAGMFFAKLIGLVYAIPFNSIMGTATNINLYGTAFQIYSYLLNISLAGFPFAVAALIAKYSTLEKYKTILVIKKLATAIMAAVGFIMMILVLFFSKPLANLIVPIGQDNMRVVLIILSIALFFVPILSSIRGFYQGLKEMEVYALSQVLEQLTRVIFLLVASSIVVYILHYDRVWAVYFGALSTGVAAILAIVHLLFHDKKELVEIKQKAHENTNEIIPDKKALVKELIYVALPYMMVAVLGYSDSIVNTVFLKNGLIAHGMSNSEIEIISQSINYGTLKLMSIPMILAPGFSAAILPMITAHLTNKEYKKMRSSITECIESVLYICIPISFCLFLYARPLYTLLFPVEEGLDTCVYILKWYSIEAFFSTIAPIFTSTVMAVGLRKLQIKISTLNTLFKLAITYPMICFFGFEGIVISSAICMILYIGADYFILKNSFHVDWKYTWRKLFLIICSLIPMILVFLLLNSIGLKAYDQTRLIGLVELGISGLLAIIAYFMTSYFFHLPQSILHVNINSLLNKFKKN